MIDTNYALGILPPCISPGNGEEERLGMTPVPPLELECSILTFIAAEF